MTAVEIEQRTAESTRWTLDTNETSVEFAVKTFWGLMTVHGRFDRFDGSYEVGPDGTTIELSIVADSLDTGHETRDKHLRSTDFFNVVEHPQVRFTSTRVHHVTDEILHVVGRLEAAGEVVLLEFPATVRRLGDALEIEATTTVDQRQLGMSTGRLGMIRSPATLHVNARVEPMTAHRQHQSQDERREASDDEMFAAAERAGRDGTRPMKLSVLGAAGATGIQLVEQALGAGHTVTALVRSGQKLTVTHPNLHVVEGDATDRAAVSEAMNGGDAVISVLGARGPVMTEATRAIVDAAKQKGPDRVVMLSSFAVARDRLTPITAVVTDIAMSTQIKDKTAGEELLRASGLDWTIVYPTKLTNGPKTEARVVPESEKVRMSQKISRAGVASFLLQAATEDLYSRSGVVITG
jgi:polyisoprenoid-binding protein YceI/uncharacterized protein YbjT (DUF2867 family)